MFRPGQVVWQPSLWGPRSLIGNLLPPAGETQLTGGIVDGRKTGRRTPVRYPNTGGNRVQIFAAAWVSFGVQADDIRLELNKHFTQTSDQAGPIAARDRDAMRDMPRRPVNRGHSEGPNGDISALQFP